MVNKLEAALALAARGFHVFPIKKNLKTPAHKGWQNEASTDPRAIADMGFISHDHNVGVFTTKFGNDNALLVVDVDNKEGKNGDEEIFKLEMDGFDFPPTLEVLTPTGGRHLIYSHTEPVKQGANVLALGLDIRSRGGFIVGADSTVKQGTYVIEHDRPVAPAPEWLVNRCGVARRPDRGVGDSGLGGVDRDRAIRRATEWLVGHAPLSVEGVGGDETAYKVACKVKDFGVDEDTANLLMLEHWNDRCSPPWDADDLAAKIHNAYAYGTEAPGANAPEKQFPPVEAEPTATPSRGPIADMNREYAFVRQGAFVLQETTDEDSNFITHHLNMAEFHGWFANKPITIGKKTQLQSECWLEWPGRREYESVVFAPQQDKGPRFYNMWRGFSVEPAAVADHPSVDAFKEHALHNVCGGDAKLFDWLMGYFAHMVQRPFEKPLVALVFKGKKGTGKNALVERVGQLLGTHFLVADDERYLLSNFNSHLESNLFFVLDEASWAGDKRAEGKLKGLITGAKHNIERKGKEAYKVRNLSRVAIIGNENWLVPASSDERRFAVFDVGNGRIQDRAFFQEMREGMEAGGYACLLRYLLDYKIATDVNEAPTTRGLYEQKVASLEPFEQWWLECLTEGRIIDSDFGAEWPERMDKHKFWDAVSRYWRRRGIRTRVPDDTVMGKAIKGFVPSMKTSRGPKPEQRYRYDVPNLETARHEWDVFIGHLGVWE
jgi:hypothetical protein